MQFNEHDHVEWKLKMLSSQESELQNYKPKLYFYKADKEMFWKMRRLILIY